MTENEANKTGELRSLQISDSDKVTSSLISWQKSRFTQHFLSRIEEFRKRENSVTTLTVNNFQFQSY